MIQQIRIFNYLCICDMTIDLSCSGMKAPPHYEDYEKLLFVQQGKGKYRTRNNRIVPVLALYGANASGKTAVLKAVNELISIVDKGLDYENFQPNRIKRCSEDKQYTEFELVFWKYGDKYDYLLRYNNKRILKERLAKNDAEVFIIEDNICKACDVSGIGDPENEYRMRCVNITNNCQIKTFLTGMAEACPDADFSINRARECLLNDILIVPENRISFFQGVNKLSSAYGNELTEEERKDRAVKEIAAYLGKLDSGIADIEIHREQPVSGCNNSPVVSGRDRNNASDGDIFRSAAVFAVHKSDAGNDVRIKLCNESGVIQLLLGFLGFLLYAVRTGKTVFIDDFDASMHSLLLIQLARLFKEKRLNAEAQLIFTAHNTDLMASDLLNRHEIGLVRYDKKSGSSFSRLADNHDLKSGADIRKLYLNGYFGGIPFPYV